MQQVGRDDLQRPHLGEVQSHLFAVEVGLVESESRFGSSQGVAETDPDPSERLEVLELHLRVKRAEQGFKSGLEEQREGEETGRRIGIRIIRTASAPSPPAHPSLLIYKY